MVNSKKKAAHFLLLACLQKSPPNDAIHNAYNEMEVDVDFYAPDKDGIQDINAEDGPIFAVYGLKWLLKNLLNKKWREYDYFSCTSEDPVVIAGFLSFFYRKPFIFLSDEIKSGAYRGNRPEYWKKVCRWAMRRASLTIVNDKSRIDLQRSYAALSASQKIVVYPGCFLNPPEDKSKPHTGKPLALAFSGNLNDLSGGLPWAINSLYENTDLTLLLQPVGINPLVRYLLLNNIHHERIQTTNVRLSWQESWKSMVDVDIGVAIYHNDGPQFQHMGISSNRLCMFLAMGVPVIVSRQPSFQFVEEYECGFMVDSQEEFNRAVKDISNNLAQMKLNALRCTKEYINTASHYGALLKAMRGLSA